MKPTSENSINKLFPTRQTMCGDDETNSFVSIQKTTEAAFNAFNKKSMCTLKENAKTVFILLMITAELV